MSSLESARCYLVRTSPELAEKSIVGVGWSKLDLSIYTDAEEAISAIKEHYEIGKRANQVRRFFAIQEGDLIVVPLPGHVAIGRATSERSFDPASVATDKANQRRVIFARDSQGSVKRLPRTAFPEAFQRRLRVQGITVNDLEEFRPEILKAYESLNTGKNYSWSLVMAEKEQKAKDEFQKGLLDNIQSGRTNLKAGGEGLELLVRELLQLEGYRAEVLSKKAFPGFADADVKASRADPCATVNLLVQVKHHYGFTNAHGLNQLEEIGKYDLPEYRDHELVFCTSASTSEEFLQRAEQLGVTVIDGAGLMEWITQHIERLSKETKNALGICEVPTVLGAT